MRRVVVFDFDGTITENDTFIDFLLFSRRWLFALALPLLVSIIMMMKIGLIKNETAKQLFISFFFKGWGLERFNTMCIEFARTIRINPVALDAIRQHLALKDEVVIISASMENWIKPWAVSHGINLVLATKLDVVDSRMTGLFSGKNCYGREKVNRLTQVFPNRTAYYLIVYGDSQGDKELLELADEGFLRTFK